MIKRSAAVDCLVIVQVVSRVLGRPVCFLGSIFDQGLLLAYNPNAWATGRYFHARVVALFRGLICRVLGQTLPAYRASEGAIKPRAIRDVVVKGLCAFVAWAFSGDVRRGILQEVCVCVACSSVLCVSASGGVVFVFRPAS